MKIILACNAAMSTSMMKMRLQQETAARGIESEVTAVPVSELDDYIEDVDVILLGPQIRYAEKDVRSKYGDVAPIIVMDMKDYGSMNAKGVLDNALKQIEAFKK